MTQESDLLRSVAREPDDDAVRLVFADWLDDQGRAERAEFIRAQVRLAQIRKAFPLHRETVEGGWYGVADDWTHPGDTPERRHLAFRARQLLESHEGEWLAPLREAVRSEWNWSRGFVETVDASPARCKHLARDFSTFIRFGDSS